MGVPMKAFREAVIPIAAMLSCYAALLWYVARAESECRAGSAFWCGSHVFFGGKPDGTYDPAPWRRSQEMEKGR
jgi:hypothetical protein